jgi:hypothetical protein
MIKEEDEKILKYRNLNNRNTACVKYETYCDTSNNRDNWKHPQNLSGNT